MIVIKTHRYLGFFAMALAATVILGAGPEVKYGDAIVLKHARYGVYLIRTSTNTLPNGGDGNWYSLSVAATLPTQDNGQWFVENPLAGKRFPDDGDGAGKFGAGVKSGDIIRLENVSAQGLSLGNKAMSVVGGECTAWFLTILAYQSSNTYGITISGHATQSWDHVGAWQRIYKYGANLGDAILQGDNVYLVSFVKKNENNRVSIIPLFVRSDGSAALPYVGTVGGLPTDWAESKDLWSISSLTSQASKNTGLVKDVTPLYSGKYGTNNNKSIDTCKTDYFSASPGIYQSQPVAELTPERIKTITQAQLIPFSLNKISTLTPVQLVALSVADQLKNLTADQAAVLPRDPITYQKFNSAADAANFVIAFLNRTGTQASDPNASNYFGADWLDRFNCCRDILRASLGDGPASDFTASSAVWNLLLDSGVKQVSYLSQRSFNSDHGETLRNSVLPATQWQPNDFWFGNFWTKLDQAYPVAQGGGADFGANGFVNTVAALIQAYILIPQKTLPPKKDLLVDELAKIALGDMTTGQFGPQTPEAIRADIVNFLSLLNPANPNSLLAKVSLVWAEKKQLLDTFFAIVQTYKFYMSDQELREVKDGFVFLDNKFQLSADAEFSGMLHAGGIDNSKTFASVLSGVDDKLKLAYNTERVTGWFKACTAGLDSEDKVSSLLTEMQTVVEAKALFESTDYIAATSAVAAKPAVPAQPATSISPAVLAQPATEAIPAKPEVPVVIIGEGKATDKDDFLNYLSTLLNTNAALKAHESVITSPKTDAKSFTYWSVQLQASAEVLDYVNLFAKIASRQDAANSASVAQHLYDKIISLQSKLSPQNVITINAAIGAFKGKGVLQNVSTLSATTTTFKGFLKQQTDSLSGENLDSKTKLFGVSDKAALLSQWVSLKRYQEFSPSFNSEFQRARFLSMLHCLDSSLDLVIKTTLTSDDQYPALEQAKDGVAAMIVQIGQLK